MYSLFLFDGLTFTGYIEEIFLPLLAVFVITWLIGFERQNVGKAAGISAHVLVSMAACGIAIMQRELFTEVPGIEFNGDGQRLIAQVIAGIGFLGAGVILKTSQHIKGLTTAATIWACAMFGLIIGMGYWALGLTLGIFIACFMYIRDFSRGFNPFIPRRSDEEKDFQKEDSIDH